MLAEAARARAPLALALGLAAALAGVSGCKRKTGPSEHYDKGAAIHQQLYVRLIDDAYLDPRMDEAVAELKQVDPRSVSYPLALELLGQIAKGKQDATAARDLRAKELAAMEAKPPPIDASRVLAASAAAQPPPPPPEPPDAGPADADPYGPGASIADINKATGGCLIADSPFREEGGAVTGTVYKLAPAESCKDKLPGFVGQAVLAINGRIYRRVPLAEVKTEDLKKADAGAAAPAVAAAPAASAAPAAPTGSVPGFQGQRPRTEPPPAFEGQKDAPKPEQAAPVKMEEAKGVKLEEDKPAQVEDSTPKAAQ